MGPFTYSNICNLAFMHKGFVVINFFVVFFLQDFSRIIFSMSLQKRQFPYVEVWQLNKLNLGATV